MASSCAINNGQALAFVYCEDEPGRRAALRSWTVLKTWSIGSISDSIGLDGFGAKACGGQPGFFDIDDRLKRLSDLGDQLETFRPRILFVQPISGINTYELQSR